jgi:hypothetical protein
MANGRIFVRFRKAEIMRVTRTSMAVLLAAGLLAGAVGVVAAAPNEKACWGQATKVFAQFEPGTMGEHASQQENPRLGLRNLARSLHEQGIIEDDSMQALGAFVADELGLSIEACQ